MQVIELIEKTREIVTMFEKVETRHWGIEAMVVELCGEVGTLADSIMIQEGYRPLRAGAVIDLEDDIVDIIFMLIRIADYYNINLEDSYQKMLYETQKKIEHRLKNNDG